MCGMESLRLFTGRSHCTTAGPVHRSSGDAELFDRFVFVFIFDFDQNNV